MLRRTLLCAALLLGFTSSSFGVTRHYAFGLKPSRAFDVWSGETLLAEGIPSTSVGSLEFDANANVPLRVVLSGAPGDFVPPAAVTTLAVTGTTLSSISLRWTAVGDDGQAGQASVYDLRYSTSPINTGNWGSATQVQGEPAPRPAGQIENFTVAGLAAGTTYHFALKVGDEVLNWSELSNVPSGTTQQGSDTTAPAAVSTLSVTITTQTSINLRWTAVGDDGNAGQASQYDIRYSTSPIDAGNWNAAVQVQNEPAPKAAGQIENLLISDLSPGTVHYFALKVGDEVPNWSGMSNVASGSTLTTGDRTAPAAVSTLATTGSTLSSISLSWTAVGDDGNAGQAKTYDLRYATAPITAGTWAGATQVQGEPTPKPAGESESFTVGGLAQGTTYYFALKVGDEVPNWSGLSNVPAGTTDREDDSIPPDAVTTLSVTATTQNSVTLGWVAVGDDGLIGRASAYDIRYSTAPIGDAQWDAAQAVQGEPPPKSAGEYEVFLVPGLAPGATYYFAMKVADDIPNWSGLSNVVSGTTAQGNPEAPATIEDLAIATTLPHQVTLTWTAVGDDGMTGQASAYDVRYSTDPITDATWSSAEQVVGEPTPQEAGAPETFDLTGLEPATSYYFALKVVDGDGNWSGLSNVVSGATEEETDPVPPAAVLDLAIGSVSQAAVGLTWTSVGDDGTEGRATTYDMRYATSPITGENWDSAEQASGEPTPKPAGQHESTAVTGLESGTTYYFALRVADEAANWSELSNVGSATTAETPDNEPPDPILDLAATQVETRRVHLRWSAPADGEPDEPSTSYEGRVSLSPITQVGWNNADPIPDLPAPSSPGEIDSVTVGGLLPGRTYYLAIRARDENDLLAPLGNVVEAHTISNPDVIPPREVSNLEAIQVTISSVTLAWSAPADSVPEDCVDVPEVAEYDIRFSTSPLDGDGWEIGVPVGAPSPADPGVAQQLVVTGLLAGTTYYFGLRSIDARDNVSETSNVVQQATQVVDGLPDTIEPGEITDLRVGSVGTTWIDLLWTATGGDGDGGTADHYDIRRHTAPINAETWEIATQILPPPPCAPAGTPESLMVGGLDPQTSYHFAMRAIDAAGNLGPITPSVPGRTEDLPDTVAPPPVTDLTAVDADTSSVALRWTAPLDDRGRVASYDLRYAPEAIDDESSWEQATPVDPPPAPSEPGVIEFFTVDGLTPATRFSFAIRSTDAAGNLSSLSNPASAQTDSLPPESPDGDATPPARIDDLEGYPASHTTVLLSWTAVGDDGTDGIATAYELHYSLAPIDSANWNLATAIPVEIVPKQAGEGETFLVSGLTPATDYHFALRARDEAGNTGPVSASVPVHTPEPPDGNPPATPDSLRAEMWGDRATLKWLPSSSLDVIDYTLYRRRVGLGGVQERVEYAGIHDLFFPDSTILPDTRYAYSISARDGAGNLSPRSSEIFIDTRLDEFLPKVLDFSAEGGIDLVGDGATPVVRLHWSATVTDRFAGFAVERSQDDGLTWDRRNPELLPEAEDYVFTEEIVPGEYLYRVSALSPRGYARTFDAIPLRWLPGAADIGIEGPFPNPSRGPLNLRFYLTKTHDVKVEMFDLSGRMLGVLLDGTAAAGVRTWTEAVVEADGQAIASGIYFLRVRVGDQTVYRKFHLRK
jgi:chitodextrinase